MSVNTVNKSDGSLQKVAGKIASGTLVPSVSYYQSGTTTYDIAEGSNNTTISVTFQSEMPDSDYVVFLNPMSGDWAEVFYAVTRRKDGFDIRFYTVNDENTTRDMSATYKWQAFKLMTDENRALDETAIAQNTSDISDLQDDVESIQAVVPSDASASNKLMTRRCIRCDNASDLENAIVNLPDYSQLDFVAVSAITIGGVTLPQYTAWHIHRDSNGLACIGGVGYSYLDGSCYKIQGSNYPEDAGLALTMQKLVTESDLTSSVISGSTAPITAGGIYSTFQGQYATMNTAFPNYQSGFCKYVSIGAFIVGSGRIQVSEDTESNVEIVSGLPNNLTIIPVLIYSSTQDVDLGYARYEAGKINVSSLKAGHNRFSFCGLLINE